MDLRTVIISALNASVRPAYPTASGSPRIGLSQLQRTLPQSTTNEIYAGVLHFEASDAFDLDVQAGEITSPATPGDAAEGLGGVNFDLQEIDLEKLYAIGIRADATNAHVISIENEGIWTDGPLGTGGATVAGEGLHLAPGGEIQLLNPAGWELAGSGAEKLTLTADATVGESRLEIVIIGASDLPESS